VFSYLVIFIVAGFISNPFRRVDVNLLLYCINAVVFAITTLSLSYLIGISVTSKKAVSAISTAISLSLAFISGMFVPQEFLGESVLRLASFTPTYWYIKVNNTIVSLTGYQWDNVSEILAMMAVQIGFAAAFISIVMVVSKRKSQQAY
jgi:ABC-2 type transport system permease protein